MGRYVKKPVEIEARQYTGENADELLVWIRTYEIPCHEQGEGIFIYTLEGEMLARPQDYIIRGVQNEFYPCKPDIFERTYSEVE